MTSPARLTAERIASETMDWTLTVHRRLLVNAIESALLAETEECAKLIERLSSNYGIYVSREEAAAAIRLRSSPSGIREDG